MFLLGKHYKSHGLYSLKITPPPPPPHSMLRVKLPLVGGDPSPRHRQVGSLAGAAHLSNDNAGVLR